MLAKYEKPTTRLPHKLLSRSAEESGDADDGEPDDGEPWDRAYIKGRSSKTLKKKVKKRSTPASHPA